MVEFYSIQGEEKESVRLYEREREMNRWSGLRGEHVYSVTISMWVQYGTVETIFHWTHTCFLSCLILGFSYGGNCNLTEASLHSYVSLRHYLVCLLSRFLGGGLSTGPLNVGNFSFKCPCGDIRSS